MSKESIKALLLGKLLETLTMRHETNEAALPFRRWGAFMPGMGLGGAGTIWNGMTWRFTPFDHEMRSHIAARYGKDAIAEDLTPMRRSSSLSWCAYIVS